MAVLGGREKKRKRKRRPLSGSFFFFYKNRPQDLQPDQGSLLRPRKSFPATQRWSKKASPVVEDEEG